MKTKELTKKMLVLTSISHAHHGTPLAQNLTYYQRPCAPPNATNPNFLQIEISSYFVFTTIVQIDT